MKTCSLHTNSVNSNETIFGDFQTMCDRRKNTNEVKSEANKGRVASLVGESPIFDFRH